MIKETIIAATLIFPTAVSAHDWYDTFCCNGDEMTGDCSVIPGTSVTATEGGWTVHLRPGEHRKVTKPQSYFVPYRGAGNPPPYERDSQDNDFHACLWPNEDHLRCLYVPPMGM